MLSGTFSATLQFEATADGGRAGKPSTLSSELHVGSHLCYGPGNLAVKLFGVDQRQSSLQHLCFWNGCSDCQHFNRILSSLMSFNEIRISGLLWDVKLEGDGRRTFGTALLEIHNGTVKLFFDSIKLLNEFTSFKAGSEIVVQGGLSIFEGNPQIKVS